MNYIDVKALSEAVETYQALFCGLAQIRDKLTAEGVDSGPLRRKMAPAISRSIRSYRMACKRYDAACEAYLAQQPKEWPEVRAS